MAYHFAFEGGRRVMAALAVWLAALAPPAGVAAQPADGLIVKRDTQLRSAPADNAPTVAAVRSGTPVTRQPERQGAWVRVRLDNAQTGWLHMFDIGSPASASAAASGGGGSNLLRGVGSLFARPSSTTVSTTTVGIRGLDASDIANSQPSATLVSQGEALRVSAQDAQQFAERSGLRPQAVNDLPAP